jgi:hypothetical protein
MANPGACSFRDSCLFVFSLPFDLIDEDIGCLANPSRTCTVLSAR